ncbi:hypothetical protein [Capillimicrobium parvum]|uniref:Uncharacterized protein n=1 Tax=Capillimicrobium parvum TaxID=2884022 RepID=A0A9E6XUX9_9ACTN|nr:hypothetical protein [Capillimicrobium parvum]UGS34236.1 hypothetical protein DSM104329_00609 [Capillimicrobium parvum]
MAEDIQSPDGLSVIGWRAWRVEFDCGVPILHSMGFEFAWPAREPAVAECLTCGDETPRQKCSCGLYSASSYGRLLSMGYPLHDVDRELLVVGQVESWGRVVRGFGRSQHGPGPTLGWRAQFGYPKRMFVLHESWELVVPLREAYGQPVLMRDLFADEGREDTTKPTQLDEEWNDR